MPKPLPKFLSADDGRTDFIIHCHAPKFVIQIDDFTTETEDNVTWWDPPPADEAAQHLLVAEALKWGSAKLDEFQKSEAPQN